MINPSAVQLLSRQLGVEIFRLEQWREKAIGGIDASLKQRKGDPVQAELDSAMKRIGELTMLVIAGWFAWNFTSLLTKPHFTTSRTPPV